MRSDCFGKCYWSGQWARGNSRGVNLKPCCADTIITGSLRGILRMYQPRQQGFSIEDLLLESQLQAPILQLELGTFTA